MQAVFGCLTNYIAPLPIALEQGWPTYGACARIWRNWLFEVAHCL